MGIIFSLFSSFFSYLGHLLRAQFLSHFVRARIHTLLEKRIRNQKRKRSRYCMFVLFPLDFYLDYNLA